MPDTKSPIDEYDSKNGTYKDPVDSMSTDDKLPLKQMPQGPDPKPFTVGPQAPGGR